MSELWGPERYLCGVLVKMDLFWTFPLTEVLSAWRLLLQSFFRPAQFFLKFLLLLLLCLSWIPDIRFDEENSIHLQNRFYFVKGPSAVSLSCFCRMWGVLTNKKAGVFTRFPVAGAMQGIECALCDSRTLSFLGKVNVPGFTGTHMWLTVHLPTHCGASRGQEVSYRALQRPHDKSWVLRTQVTLPAPLPLRLISSHS